MFVKSKEEFVSHPLRGQVEQVDRANLQVRVDIFQGFYYYPEKTLNNSIYKRALKKKVPPQSIVCITVR